MTEWSLRLLGDLVLASPGAERRLRLGRKGSALLVRVALQGRLGVTREHLASLLWDAPSARAALNALRQCLHGVRAELGPAARCLERVDNRIVWRDDQCPVDVRRFESLARSRDEADLMAAAHAYRGDLVESIGVGPDFGQWLDAERERLRGLAHAVIAELASRDLGRAHQQVAQDLGRRLLASDRLHEGACLSLMRLYASAGLRAKALAVQADFSAGLRAELGLAPGAPIAAFAAALAAPSEDPGPAPRRAGRDGLPEAGGARGAARPVASASPADARISDLMLRGWHAFTAYTGAGMAAAREAYTEVVALEPCHAPALSLLGWTHWFDAIGGWSTDPAAALTRADALAARALGCGADDAAPHALTGKVRLWQMRHADALAHLERALQLAQAPAFAQFHLGDALMWCGRPAESLKRVEQALRLAGDDRGVFLTIRGMALWMAGDGIAARGALESAARRNPSYSWAHRALSVVHQEAGDRDAAEREADLAQRLNPRFRRPFAEQGLPFLLPEHRSRFEQAWVVPRSGAGASPAVR